MFDTREFRKFKVNAYDKGKIVEFTLEKFDNDLFVFVFYPYDFTFVCPTEINEISDHYEEFLKRKCGVFFVSCDSVYSHKKWAETPREEKGIQGVKFPMVSDYNKKITTFFHLLREPDGHCARATVILDKNGKVRYYAVNDDKVGRSVPEILRIIDAIQFVDENGEVCKVNWKKSE
ncbi:thioredoxin peroxidase [Hamiltosporidium tvaerminnensis]|uniref:Thioredoxin peroxidase n=2 Tax=Hamiltosporidium TaxID=1176354 RepID=A0A4Q9LHB1_9MICR|nr:thioredoxin peroxidase [Hamiltosporidium tvaerminnensis]TBU07508.1 thioredoxin peroxidase [Hamiltosporidium magnivora]